jgi:hypothetical protein
MRHSRVRWLLYEYVRGELSLEESRPIAEHLLSCQRCAREVEQNRTIVTATATHLRTATDQRSAEYWRSFIDGVEERIDAGRPEREPPFTGILDAIRSLALFHRPALAIAACSVGLVIGGFLALRLVRVEPVQPEEAVRTDDKPAQTIAVDDRMGDYLRKSKVLLVGISNFKNADDGPFDLSAERRVSRGLVDQARYLKNQPLDMRSARLIGDLEKVLIELANIKEEGGAPNVDLIRSGIQRQNLLFKIRMAEALCDSTRKEGI